MGNKLNSFFNPPGARKVKGVRITREFGPSSTHTLFVGYLVLPSVGYAGRGFFDMQTEKPANWLCQAGLFLFYCFVYISCHHKDFNLKVTGPVSAATLRAFFIVYNFAPYMKLNL